MPPFLFMKKGDLVIWDLGAMNAFGAFDIMAQFQSFCDCNKEIMEITNILGFSRSQDRKIYTVKNLMTGKVREWVPEEYIKPMTATEIARWKLANQK